ncbi:glycosyltransferase [Aureimonas leprariae]|uniref:Glycosyltransferase n=1 Tax=Plantimonas leprariae TaxID=2615207 RepID=A0A7V7TVC0_9HYPH|nr:glycosyltransferase [Aureimonas leprariae]KAB0677330.1 glycosyltransferase [Aureimonas leprariae]
MQPCILYVHDLRSSGVVRNALAYAERIAQDRPTTLLAGSAQGLFRREAGSGGFVLATLSDGAESPSRLAAARHLRRWLSDRPGGVLLSVGNHGHPSVYWATRGLPRFRRIYRISSQTERDGGLRDKVRLRWMAMLVADADRIALVGDALSRTPFFARSLRDGKAAAIPNGLDRAAALRLASAPSPHPWLEDAVPVVLGVGRLRPQKNFDLLIEAVGIARRERRMRLAILGGGERRKREHLAGLAAEAGLGTDFLLAGETANVFAWIARAHVFALPSRWEGSSMALLEALAVGTPAVASRLAGDAASVLGEGRHGLLFDGTDPAALAAALLHQTSDAPVRPGDRADQYGLSAERYAALVGEVDADDG